MWGKVRRVVLVACLLHQAKVRARDEVVGMCIRRMNALHSRARLALADLKGRQQEINDHVVATFSGVLAAARSAAESAPASPAEPQRWNAAFGQAAAAVLAAGGGVAALSEQTEALKAFAGDNHLPLVERFYRSHRSALFQMTATLALEATSAYRSLLDALAVVLEGKARTGEFIDDHVAGRRIDLSFASGHWRRLLADKAQPGRLVRRHFEVCVFSYLTEHLRTGDIAVTGSASYANWQSELLDWSQCEPLLAEYCAEVSLPAGAAAFTGGLKAKMLALAAGVDRGYPDNADLVIDDRGRPVLTPYKGKDRTASAVALEKSITARLPERSLLDILVRTANLVPAWWRAFGPASGSDPKLADPLHRYLLIAFCYGTNLGPAQTARHLRGSVSPFELASIAKRHVTAARLDRANAAVVNAYARLELPRRWGDGTKVATDGTKYDVYADNLMAEYHIRYGGYGGIAYHHVADTYIALFSRFVPCGVWEAVYIIEGLLDNASEVKPTQVHADTQGQSFPVFGLAYLFGFELLPRIRNFKDRVFSRPTQDAAYRHIDALFGDPIDWGLIERHWQDLMRVVLSIRAGRLSSATLLRRLRHDSRRNRICRAFRELGRVIATMTLLRYISETALREQVLRATTNKAEAYNGFAQWLFFGNFAVIADNDPDDQEIAIKFNTLLANLVVLSNTLDMTRALDRIRAAGEPADDADLAVLSPYRHAGVKRFGEYVLDLDVPPDDEDLAQLSEAAA